MTFGQPSTKFSLNLLRTEYISVCPYDVPSLCTCVHTHLPVLTCKNLVSHRGLDCRSVLGKGLAWGRQHGSFLCYPKQIFVQFRWLCRNGQGLGYKHWAWAFPSGLGVWKTFMWTWGSWGGASGERIWQGGSGSAPGSVQEPRRYSRQDLPALRGLLWLTDLMGRVRNEEGSGLEEWEENFVIPQWPFPILCTEENLGNHG